MDNLPFPTEISQFIIWMASGGATGILASLLFERWPVFRNWKHPLKKLVTLVFFIAVPFLGKLGLWAVQVIDPAVLKVIQDILATAFIGLVAWGSSLFAHAYDKDNLTP